MSANPLIATIVWEARIGGNDENGGGYESDAGTTDHTLQDSPELDVTDGSTDFTTDPDLSSATGGFTAQMVGNVVHVFGGTNVTDGWYRIIAFVDTNKVTLDRAPDDAAGAVSGASVKVGGAFKTYGQIGKVFLDHGISGMIAFMKRDATAFAVTDAGDNVPNGVINWTSTSESYTLVGYDSNRTVDNTDALRPVIEISGAVTPAAMLDMNNTADAETQYAANLHFDVLARDCTSGVMVRGSGVGHAETVVRRIKCDAQSAAGLDCFSSLRAVECHAIDGEFGFDSGSAVSCYAVGFSATGFFRHITVSCTADACAVGFANRLTAETGIDHVNCLAIGCTSDGFQGDAGDGVVLANCASVDNTGVGYNAISGAMLLINCASGNNTGGRLDVGSPALDIGAITLDVDAFDGKASGDFRPNDAATGGARLRAAATFPQSNTLNATNDVGPVQHADPAGGGGGTKLVGFGGGMIG